MTLPEAILFDMDGTIVDTEPLWEGAEGQVLAEMGTQMTPQMRQKMLGSTLPRMVAILRSFARNPLDEAVVSDRSTRSATTASSRGVRANERKIATIRGKVDPTIF